MAITIDQTSLGTQATSSTASSVKATTAAVATGGTIIALVLRFNSSGGTLSMSGGSLTWVECVTATSGSIRVSLFAAFAPSGLASATNVTVTPSLGSTDVTWEMCSYAGIDQSGTVAAAIRAFNSAAAATAAWATPNVTGSSGDGLIGGAAGDGTLRTSTPTSPALERIDFNSATTGESATTVDKLSISGTDTLAGTWSGTLGHIAVGVAFKPAAGGPSSFNQSATDTITVSETLTRVRSGTRAVTETIALSEVVTGPVGRPRGATDALTVTDSAAGTIGHTVTATDAIAISEAVTRALALTRATSDALGIAEATTDTVGHPRAVTDALTVTDAATRSAALHPRAVTDTVTVTDSATSNGGGTPVTGNFTLPTTGAG